MKKFLTTAALAFMCASAQAEDVSSTLPDTGELLAERALGEGVEIELGEDNPQMPLQKLDVFGFDFTRSNIHSDIIVETGKLPWEIPTIIEPRFVSLEDVRHDMVDEDYLILVEINGESKAYPVKILNWHKGVNDTVGGKNVFVVWDPLSGNAMAFNRDMRGKTFVFGDSGMVYRSSSLYFDEQTRSLWLPTLQRAVTGKMAPSGVESVPVAIAQYKELAQAKPYVQVMSFDIPNTDGANYMRNPYGDYGRNKHFIYPVNYADDRMPRKEPVLGVTLTRAGKKVDVAFSINALINQPDQDRLEFTFETGRHPSEPKIPMDIKMDEVTGQFLVTSLPEVDVDIQYSYWFSWIAHHPKSYAIHKLP